MIQITIINLITGYMRIKVNVQLELYTPEHICQRRRKGNYVAVAKILGALMQLPLSVGCNMATRCLTTVIIFRATIQKINMAIKESLKNDIKEREMDNFSISYSWTIQP